MPTPRPETAPTAGSSERSSGGGGPLGRGVRALIRLQTTRPWALLLVALATVIVAGLLASRLELRTSFGELLPRNKESVVVADRVNARLVSASTLTLVAEGNDQRALEGFIDALAPKIRALGPDYVGAVDDGVRASQEFFKKNELLYAPLADVQKVHDEIVDRYDYEVAKEMGTSLDDDATAPPAITADTVRERLAKRQAEATSTGPRFPDGYYMEPDGKMIAILIRTPVSSGDVEQAKRLTAKLDELIAAVDPKRFDPTMRVSFTGDFITAQEEYDKIKNDLSHVGLTGVAMILGVVLLFYLRLRTLLAMGLTVAIGVAWTFGFAYLSIGHLNSSTGFLVSIVVGNGINFGIIYMARYLEARRTEDATRSVLTAHRETWLSTAAAAGAAMVAYGSLVITNFRGFKHFGIIGGAGMALCWIATYLFLPALLVGFERILPVTPDGPRVRRLRGAYGYPFAFVATRFPRLVVIVGVALGLGSGVLAYHYLASDPMEYDMLNTRTEAPDNKRSASEVLGERVEAVVGRQGQDGLAIMTDRVEQVLPLKAALDRRLALAPADAKPFENVVTIFDLLPTDQPAKLALIAEARDRLERSHRRKLLSDEDWDEVSKYLPASSLSPIGIAELPEQVARAFVEKDGTRGRLVYIVPKSGRSVWDARYLILWADSFRRTELPDGSVVKGSGRSVIFADLILAVIEDAPKAIVASLLGTLFVVVLAFRSARASLAVVATLGLGLLWMIAAMVLWHAKLGPTVGPIPGVTLTPMRLNFLNFVALPISIGVGADYAVNVMQRYRLVGRGHLNRVIRETGGAVILCSLTTMLGYFALTFSVNKAIVSFGYAAAAGEVSCVLAAVLVLPAFLAWRERGRSGAAAEAERKA